MIAAPRSRAAIALAMVSLAMTSCTSKPVAHAASASTTPGTAQLRKGDDLQAAMDKLEESIHKPSVPFHASFKKSDSDGFTYECEADISPAGITGQQIDSNPVTKVGDDVFPANTRTRQLNGTPYGSPNFQTAYGGISMAYLNGHIGDAQAGVKYVGDEQTGGYDARHYDFDLTGVDATIKRAMTIGNSMGMRQTKDYNMKGSAWIAKDDGRMVKFSLDNIFTFADGKTSDTHFEGLVTKK
jgi:hypothetical protein